MDADAGRLMGIRGGFIAVAKPKRVSVEVTVTRANGRVERYGRVAYYHRNPLMRWAGCLVIAIKRRVWK